MSTVPRSYALLLAIVCTTASSPGPALASVSERGAEQTSAPSSRAEAAQPFVGTWHFVGGERERKRLAAAIDAAVAEMPWIIRSAARRKLEGTQKIADRIVIEASDTELAITAHGRGHTVRTPADGRVVERPHPDGGTFTASQQVNGGKLVQVLTAEGRKRNEYRLSSDGGTMTMHVEVRAEKLPKPLRYKLTFKAAAAAK